MNVDTFYEKMKDALNHLNVSWGDKDLVTVEIEGDWLVFYYCDDSVKFRVKK